MRRPILMMVLLAMVSSVAFSQTPAESWDNLKQLRKGQNVHVVDSSFKKVKGRFVALTAESLTYRAGEQEVSVPRSEVVMVAQPASKARSILVGALVGAVVGFSLWREANNHARGCWDDEGYICDRDKGLSGRSALIYTGVGAAIAGLAAAFTEEGAQVVYLHDPNRTPELLPPLPPAAVADPEAPGFEPQPYSPGLLEGGNVFAPERLNEEPGVGEGKEVVDPQ